MGDKTWPCHILCSINAYKALKNYYFYSSDYLNHVLSKANDLISRCILTYLVYLVNPCDRQGGLIFTIVYTC